MASVRLRLKASEVHLDAKTVNHILKEYLGSKAQSVTKDPDLRQAIGEEYIRIVNSYVPMRTGKLRNSAHAERDGRIYWATKYAEKQYTTHYRHYTTPGTGPYWTANVRPGTSDWDEDFMDAITPLIIRRFSEHE